MPWVIFTVLLTACQQDKNRNADVKGKLAVSRKKHNHNGCGYSTDDFERDKQSAWHWMAPNVLWNEVLCFKFIDGTD